MKILDKYNFVHTTIYACNLFPDGLNTTAFLLSQKFMDSIIPVYYEPGYLVDF